MKKTRYLFISLLMFTLLFLCGCEERSDREAKNDDRKYFAGEADGEDGEQKVIEIHSYTGAGGTLTMENEYLLFEMNCETTQFTVKDKNSEAVWYSNPKGVEEDPIATSMVENMLRSTLLLAYSGDIDRYNEFDSYSSSVISKKYEIEKGKDEQGEFVKVLYSLGEVEMIYIIPEVIAETRMLELFDKMDENDASYIEAYYKKYDINNLSKKDNREELLARYPLLESEVIYVLRNTASDVSLTKLEWAFGAVGYTYEDAKRDKAAVEMSDLPKPLFNISMIYRLEGDRLSVEIPVKGLEYQESYYTLLSLTVLPYFGAGSQEDEGYIMLPEEDGKLVYFNSGEVDYWIGNAFSIVGNGATFLCILEEGAVSTAIDASTRGTMKGYNYAMPTYILFSGDLDSRDSSFAAKSAEGGLKWSYSFLQSDKSGDIEELYRQYIKEK